jgi:hypothetical protein
MAELGGPIDSSRLHPIHVVNNFSFKFNFNLGGRARVRPAGWEFVFMALAGGVAATPEGGALACPSALTPTSSWWALVAL